MLKRELYFWRAAAGAVLGIWIVVTVINLFRLDPLKLPQPEQNIVILPVFMGLSMGTVFGLTVLVIFPLKFYIYTGIFCFWGLEHIVEGGDVCGLLMYVLGWCFACRQGYFKTYRSIKVLAAIVLGMAAVGLQYRYGLAVIIDTVLRCFAVLMMGGIGALLVLPEIQKFRDYVNDRQGAESEPVSADPQAALPSDMSEPDRVLLEHIQRGEKYESIAREMEISVPTVKRRTRRLFRDLGVSARTEFMERYGSRPDTFLSK